LYTYYKNKLGEEQNGFQKEQACSGRYFTLKILVKGHREFNSETPTAYVDFKRL
jgi:hypothetical protein